MRDSVRLHKLGLMPYDEAWDWQRSTAEAVREGATEALAVLQHPPVYTFGRRIRREHLLLPPADAEVVETDRGGDVTYHGPGQLIAYPVLDLHRRNLGAADYVRLLEETMIRTAAVLGVGVARIAGRPGVWVEPCGAGGKLGAVGVRMRGGVSTHGLALNVTTDLSRFDAIVPCGLAGIRVTSLANELGYAPNYDAVEDAFLAAFETVFDCRLRSADAGEAAPISGVRHGR